MLNKKYDTQNPNYRIKEVFLSLQNEYNRTFIYYPSKSSTFVPNNYTTYEK